MRMTKKWSSTKSLDGQTKRQASKKKRRIAKGYTRDEQKKEWAKRGFGPLYGPDVWR